MDRQYFSQASPHPMHYTDLSYRGIYLGHWKLGLQSGVLSLCPSAKRLLGRGRTSQAGLWDAFQTLSFRDRMMLIRAYKGALHAGSNLDIELKVSIPGGKTKWMKILGTLSYRRWSIPDHFIGTIEDITQRQMEENLNLSIIGHEIRDPLSIIKLNTELVIRLMRPDQDKRQVRLLSMVDEHVNGIASVLDEHLSATANEDRRINLQLGEFDLHHVLNQLLSEIQVLYSLHKFDRKYAGEMWVSADKNRVVRVLINYLTNAVKFSHPSSVIKISSAVRDRFAEVCVCDQGVGIPSGWEEKIFEKYAICPDRKGRQQNSKGLGLYLVKNIIEKHGGKVRAEQIKQGGTAFYFSLPLLQEEETKFDALASFS